MTVMANTTDITNTTNITDIKDVEIGAFIVVYSRMCKILLCECNEKLKKMYIRCVDIETNKGYAVFVSKSLFLHENFVEGDCSTIIDNTIEHIANHNNNYNFRSKLESDFPDSLNLNDVEMYSAGHSNVIIGCYLRDKTNYYIVSDYKINSNKIEIVSKHIYTKEITVHTIIPKINDNLMEIGNTTIINTHQDNYICCYDQKNNVIGFALKGMNL